MKVCTKEMAELNLNGISQNWNSVCRLAIGWIMYKWIAADTIHSTCSESCTLSKLNCSHQKSIVTQNKRIARLSNKNNPVKILILPKTVKPKFWFNRLTNSISTCCHDAAAINVDLGGVSFLDHGNDYETSRTTKMKLAYSNKVKWIFSTL